MSAHTPGPWLINGEFDSEISVEIASAAWPICELDPVEWSPEEIANARLIAAAPELLEACKLVSSDHGSSAALRAVLKAIAKAEGRQ